MVGVTQLRNVVYLVCDLSSTIGRFDATTHRRLTDVDVKGLRSPTDIVACEQTSQLYVADEECIWRVSSNGEDIMQWPPESPSDVFKPLTLSVTAARLLVTSLDPSQLIQFDANGSELTHVRLWEYRDPRHAVESPNQTFIVSHGSWELTDYCVSEVDTEGQVLRQFCGSRLSSPSWYLPRIAADSRGNVFVAEFDSCRVLLLDAQLVLRRVITDERQLTKMKPRCMCYREQSGQLLVGTDSNSIAVFGVLRC